MLVRKFKNKEEKILFDFNLTKFTRKFAKIIFFFDGDGNEKNYYKLEKNEDIVFNFVGSKTQKKNSCIMKNWKKKKKNIIF